MTAKSVQARQATSLLNHHLSLINDSLRRYTGNPTRFTIVRTIGHQSPEREMLARRKVDGSTWIPERKVYYDLSQVMLLGMENASVWKDIMAKDLIDNPHKTIGVLDVTEWLRSQSRIINSTMERYRDGW